MTRFVDTTLRLLSQDPLARTLSGASILLEKIWQASDRRPALNA